MSQEELQDMVGTQFWESGKKLREIKEKVICKIGLYSMAGHGLATAPAIIINIRYIYDWRSYYDAYVGTRQSIQEQDGEICHAPVEPSERLQCATSTSASMAHGVLFASCCCAAGHAGC